MTDDEDNIRKLPVRFKKPPSDDEPTLKIVHHGGCDHRWRWAGDPMAGPSRMVSVTYQIRGGETEVECGACGTRLDPMWVLSRLANEEVKWREYQKRYAEEMRRLAERERTKCQHCNRMTQISRR